MSQDLRCPSCGALVSAEADWCGQCYAPLSAGSAPDGSRSVADDPGPGKGPVRTPGGGGIEVSEGKPAWDCPVCGERNPIQASTCSACGTPFSRLFAEPEVRPEVEPQTAAVWSLAFPGLGHWRCGRRADAIARFSMFAWAFGALLVLLVSRFGKGGLGPTVPLFLLFLVSSAAIYVLSAIDAYRIASGDDPMVSSRVLLWASAAVVVMSVMVATFITLPAARR